MAKPVTFLKEVKVEMGKVTWPTRKEAIRLTLVVIAVSVLVGIFIGGADYILTKIMAIILGR
ncbi:MAG: preprotein translocase subunit SecE [bacterium]|nr:preprotein translocase subunit SecE [bacterium]